MPTYQYACTECGHQFEIVQSFSDDALSHCPECDGRLRKVFNAVGVVFKGSGFYRTDSRSADGKSGSSLSGSSSDSGSGKSDKTSEKSADKAATKPAEKPSGKSSGGTSSASSSGSGSSSTGS